MNTPRVLIVSNVRPSRTWNFANRIVREVPGTTVSSVVQGPMRSIPWGQWMIANGMTRDISTTPGRWAKTRFFFYSLADKIVEWFLWFVHGCPASLSNSKFTMKRLRQECALAGWPLVFTGEGKGADVSDLSLKGVDLTIILGQPATLPKFPGNTSRGCIRACIHKPSAEGEASGSVSICIEHFAPAAETPSPIFSQYLPWQPFDGSLGFTLKADLISDDLLLQTAQSLLAGNLESALTGVSQWANRFLAPSLTQLNDTQAVPLLTEPGRKRCRSTWKLCLDTLLLLSPGVLVRNWYRRIRGCHPVLVLAHHLVSDRPHRMGVSTETFWRQVLFLKKHYRIVTIAEGCKLSRSGRVRVPTVVLSFDDGYADNFLSLRAVASETDTPFTLFITTGPVEDHREFDHDLATGRTGFLPLTWDQIAYWSAQGAEFGSHTRTHFDCGSVDLERLQSEIIGSRQDLEAHLKKPVNFFAFPYGKKGNMSAAAMHLAAVTYRYYFSSFGGESFLNVKKTQSHLFRKKFYGSLWELELELQSVFDFVDALKRRFHSQAASSSGSSDRVPVASTLSPSIPTVSAPSGPTAVYSHVKES